MYVTCTIWQTDYYRHERFQQWQETYKCVMTVEQFYRTLFSYGTIQWPGHFPSGTLVMVWAWKQKTTLLINIIATINYNS